jgi:hypothetical protein
MTFSVRLIQEAVVVGITIALIGTLVSWVLSKVTKTHLPPVCDDWNKNFIMEITLFFVGFIAHIGFEVVGANKWYCSNGNACIDS